jgi:hypothetical protein
MLPSSFTRVLSLCKMASQSKSGLTLLLDIAKKIGSVQLGPNFEPTFGPDFVKLKLLGYRILRACVALDDLKIQRPDSEAIDGVLEELEHAGKVANLFEQRVDNETNLLDETLELPKAGGQYEKTCQFLDGVRHNHWKDLRHHKVERLETILIFYEQKKLKYFLDEVYPQILCLESTNPEIEKKIKYLAFNALESADIAALKVLASSSDPLTAEVAEKLLGKGRTTTFNNAKTRDKADTQMGSKYAAGQGVHAGSSEYNNLDLSGESKTHAGDIFESR